MGVVVAMLSVTGVIIWNRKRRARLAVKRHASAADGHATGMSPAE